MVATTFSTKGLGDTSKITLTQSRLISSEYKIKTARGREMASSRVRNRRRAHPGLVTETEPDRIAIAALLGSPAVVPTTIS
jgi:hypothetical protein